MSALFSSIPSVGDYLRAGGYRAQRRILQTKQIILVHVRSDSNFCSALSRVDSRCNTKLEKVICCGALNPVTLFTISK